MLRSALRRPAASAFRRNLTHSLWAPSRTVEAPSIFKRNLSACPPRRYPRVYVRFGGNETPDPSNQDYPQKPRPDRGWNRPTRFGAIMITTVGIWYLVHLEQVPETGRWRYMSISPDSETQIAKWVEQSEPNQPQLPLNHPVTLHVHRVVNRLLEANNLGTIKDTLINQGNDSSGFVDMWDSSGQYSTVSDSKIAKRQWDVRVIPDNRTVNAAALPGIIYVYTGILPICRDEQGLASVLSHEIGHVVARHTAERMSTAFIFYPLALVVSAIFSNSTILGDLLFTYVLQNPNSRTQEKEADVIGLRMMAKACYDPRAAPEMFRRLGAFENAHGGGGNVEFLSTHPKSEHRVKYLESLLPEAYDIRAASSCPSGLESNLRKFGEAVGVRPISFGRDNDMW